jgi:outer membrane protein OmpA-like peptidoglycan-associated protein
MQISSERKKVETGSDSTKESYNLILFPFNSAEAGLLNDRIMKDYVYSRCKASSRIVVTGHTDTKGLDNTNLKLSERRAGSVSTGIQKKTKGAVGKLTSVGVGEENPLFTNDLPEGRFYNRTVHVLIRTPVQDAE